MESTSSSLSTVFKDFTNFSQLPTEIRLRIWAFAASHQPRAIQIYYDREKVSWQAWQDGRGGLSAVALTSREAFAEVMKGYTKVLDTYMDLELDTVFISDPMFTLRRPRKSFMALECANLLKKVAFSTDVFLGLQQAHFEWPQFCVSLATILRELGGLKHFTLVLSDDEDYMESPDISVASTDEDIEAETEGNHEDNENQGQADEAGVSLEAEPRLGDLARRDRHLDHLEQRAMEKMSRGYFRHVGDIHFESAMGSPDHWESWLDWKDEVEEVCREEKTRFPDWIRPKVSIMIVRYGLQPRGDFTGELIHLLGDHSGGIVQGFDELVEDDS